MVVALVTCMVLTRYSSRTTTTTILYYLVPQLAAYHSNPPPRRPSPQFLTFSVPWKRPHPPSSLRHGTPYPSPVSLQLFRHFRTLFSGVNKFVVRNLFTTHRRRPPLYSSVAEQYHNEIISKRSIRRCAFTTLLVTQFVPRRAVLSNVRVVEYCRRSGRMIWQGLRQRQ